MFKIMLYMYTFFYTYNMLLKVFIFLYVAGCLYVCWYKWYRAMAMLLLACNCYNGHFRSRQYSLEIMSQYIEETCDNIINKWKNKYWTMLHRCVQLQAAAFLSANKTKGFVFRSSLSLMADYLIQSLNLFPPGIIVK